MLEDHSFLFASETSHQYLTPMTDEGIPEFRAQQWTWQETGRQKSLLSLSLLLPLSTMALNRNPLHTLAYRRQLWKTQNDISLVTLAYYSEVTECDFEHKAQGQAHLTRLSFLDTGWTHTQL